MRFFDAAAVAAALPFETLVPALRAGFAEGCSVPPRQVLEIPAGDAAAAGVPPLTSLVMPAWQAGRYYALKCVNVAPGNAARGLPGLHASLLLHDARSGVPLAWMEGSELTSRRTAAASALAASWLARTDSRRLLVVGAGRVAALLPAAYRAVRPIERVTVWARRADAAEALAAQWRAEGFDAVATSDLAAAAAAADIVSCATLATEPVVRGAWLRAGSHLDLIGSFTPAMREADDEAFAGAAIVVDTDEALAKSGELIGPMARGVFSRAELRGTLAALARGEVQGRRRDDERTVFKSVGSALEDLVAAVQVWERAAAA
ncbi:MAG: ornithine cyclodeaminase family protein [Burkholderiales bacterium]|nr:ornithine cyclodeaminase family protein [Burkholderiales bacterium]